MITTENSVDPTVSSRDGVALECYSKLGQGVGPFNLEISQLLVTCFPCGWGAYPLAGSFWQLWETF